MSLKMPTLPCDIIKEVFFHLVQMEEASLPSPESVSRKDFRLAVPEISNFEVKIGVLCSCVLTPAVNTHTARSLSALTLTLITLRLSVHVLGPCLGQDHIHYGSPNDSCETAVLSV